MEDFVDQMMIVVVVVYPNEVHNIETEENCSIPIDQSLKQLPLLNNERSDSLIFGDKLLGNF